MGKPSARSSWFRGRSSISLSDLASRFERKAFVILALTLIVIGVAPLGGCGFRPLYGENSVSNSTVGDLANVSVNSPENEIGRALRYDLLDVLNPDGNQPASPLYTLNLTPYSYSQDVAIQSNASVTRANVVLTVPFTLTSVETGKTVFASTARARTSYNRVESEFANLTAGQDAQKRIAKVVVDDIKLQLSVFFDRNPGAAKAASSTK